MTIKGNLHFIQILKMVRKNIFEKITMVLFRLISFAANFYVCQIVNFVRNFIIPLAYVVVRFIAAVRTKSYQMLQRAIWLYKTFSNILYYVRRAIVIIIRALCGSHSPSLGREIRISDIWKTPNYIV